MLGPGEILDFLWLSERDGSSESRRADRADGAEQINGLLIPDAKKLDSEGHQHHFRGGIQLGIHWILLD